MGRVVGDLGSRVICLCILATGRSRTRLCLTYIVRDLVGRPCLTVDQRFDAPLEIRWPTPLRPASCSRKPPCCQYHQLSLYLGIRERMWFDFCHLLGYQRLRLEKVKTRVPPLDMQSDHTDGIYVS